MHQGGMSAATAIQIQQIITCLPALPPHATERMTWMISIRNMMTMYSTTITAIHVIQMELKIKILNVVILQL